MLHFYNLLLLQCDVLISWQNFNWKLKGYFRLTKVHISSAPTFRIRIKLIYLAYQCRCHLTSVGIPIKKKKKKKKKKEFLMTIIMGISIPRKMVFALKWNPGYIISMALCKTAISPLLTHWRYCSLALSHRYKPSSDPPQFTNSWQPEGNQPLHPYGQDVFTPDSLLRHYNWY